MDPGPLGPTGDDRTRFEKLHRDTEMARLDGRRLGQRLQCPLARRVRPDRGDHEAALNERREHCPIARALELLGDRWTLLALREVFYGNNRFQGIVARTGAPRDILTIRLGRVLDAGLLSRRPYNPGGTRFEYVPTAGVLAVRPILVALGEFAETELPDPAGPDPSRRELTPSAASEGPSDRA